LLQSFRFLEVVEMILDRYLAPSGVAQTHDRGAKVVQLLSGELTVSEDSLKFYKGMVG
jgi:hypothetical protein